MSYLADPTVREILVRGGGGGVENKNSTFHSGPLFAIAIYILFLKVTVALKLNFNSE